MKIALIGMAGVGKTTVGMLLAQKLGIKFTDTDEIIVSRLGMPITQVFLTVGEKVFRSYERDVLKEVVWEDDIVLGCGGGIVLSPANMEMLAGFNLVRLTASPETIYERIKDDFSRPLLTDNSPPSLKRIMDEREHLYAKYAGRTVDTNGKTAAQVTDEIYEILSDWQ